jgi:hypothetical protein
VEISRSLVLEAQDKVRKEHLQDQVKILQADFMNVDLSSANVVTLYLATTANESLRPRLEQFLKPKTRVVSYDYPIPGWKPIDTTETASRFGAPHLIYLYEVPESIGK